MKAILASAIAIAWTAASAAPAIPVAIAAASDPSPIAHWSMDEGSGSVASDAGPGGIDLSIASPHWVQDGHDGAALHFSGTAGAIAPADELHLTDLTVSLWVRADPENPPAEDAAIVELGGRAGCGHATWGLYVDGPSFHFGWTDADTATFHATEGWAVEGHNLWNGAWHHIAVAISADPYAYLTERIDGFPSGATQASPHLDYAGLVFDNLTVGAIAGDCALPHGFTGDIDDLRLFDRQLTSDQIGGLEPSINTTALLSGPTTALTWESPCFAFDVTPGPGGGDVDITLTPTIGVPIHHSMTWQYAGHAAICLSVATGTYDISASFSNGRPWVAAASNGIHLVVSKRISSASVTGRDPQLSSGTLWVDGFVDGHDVIPSGNVSFYEIVDGARVPRGSGTLAYTGTNAWSVATLSLPARGTGTYQFEIDYAGDANHTGSTGQGSIQVTPGLSDTTPPLAKPPSWSLVAGLGLDAGRPKLRIVWSGSDDMSGIDHFDIAQSTDGGTFVTIASQVAPRNLDRLVALGHTYRFRVRAVDVAGNVGAWAYGALSRLTAISQSTPAVHYHGSWSTVRSSTIWWGGTARRSSTAGSSVSYTFTGRSIAWVGMKAQTRGRVRIYINGVLLSTVDLRSSTVRTKHIIWQKTWSTAATRRITIKVVATPGRPRVDIDGFIVGS